MPEDGGLSISVHDSTARSAGRGASPIAGTYSLLAELPLRIDSVSLVELEQLVSPEFTRRTTQAGCGLAPARAPDGSGPIAMAENPVTRTVYAVNEEDDDMSVIDARTCNATDHAGCEQTPPALAIGGRTTAHVTLGSDDGAGAVAVDPSTDTLYATSQAENNVSILNGATCNGVVTWGCSVFAPTTTVGNAPQGVAADPATGTVYVSNGNDDTVSVIDASVCDAFTCRL